MKHPFKQIVSDWRNFFSDRNQVILALITLVAIVAVVIVYPRFLNMVEMRNGTELNDPLLSSFKPMELTWIIFVVLYFSCFFAIIKLIKTPAILMDGLQIYILLIVVRMIAMYFMPLNPPKAMIPLVDPFVQLFGIGKTLTKDLFFSGHTATIFLLFLLTPKGILKMYFLLASMAIAVCVILQHVHYSIDVFAAPVFAYACFTVIQKIKNSVNGI
jgi:hypothetical protein